MDYRSLYLHFENGVFMYKNDAVMQLKHDMEKTFEISQRITKENVSRKFKKNIDAECLTITGTITIRG